MVDARARCRSGRWIRVATTVFFGFGTVFWYAAQIGTTWYQAHVLAVGLALLAIGVAIGADRRAARDEDELGRRGRGAGRRPPRPGAALRRRPWIAASDRPRQFLAGLLFGLACTSRLTVRLRGAVLRARRRRAGRGNGAAGRRRSGPGSRSALLVVYNLVSTGHLFHPGYQYLYELEAGFYIPLNYNLDWAIEDLRYLPQNFGIMFLNTPVLAADRRAVGARRSAGRCAPTPARSAACSTAIARSLLPRDTGMSMLLTSPAYLLVLPALRWGYGRSRLVTGAALAVLIIAFVNLMHFSQGWVQFGYRFSLDFVPWALLLVAIGLERVAGGRAAAGPGGLAVLALALVACRSLVNLWGVVWGDVLGW